MTDTMTDPPIETPVAGLPYAFARRHGVIVRATAAGGECVTRGPPALAAVLEVQRLFGAGLPIVPLDEAGFDAALSAQYRDSAAQASDAASASDQDLAALADSASAVDDLLDNRDDSPVIRLINALCWRR